MDHESVADRIMPLRVLEYVVQIYIWRIQGLQAIRHLSAPLRVAISASATSACSRTL